MRSVYFQAMLFALFLLSFPNSASWLCSILAYQALQPILAIFIDMVIVSIPTCSGYQVFCFTLSIFHLILVLSTVFRMFGFGRQFCFSSSFCNQLTFLECVRFQPISACKPLHSVRYRLNQLCLFTTILGFLCKWRRIFCHTHWAHQISYFLLQQFLSRN